MDLGNGVEVNFSKLSDEQLAAARTEVEAAGQERGLWAPEGAGQIAVAQTVDIEAERARLLGTVEEGAVLFNRAVQAINGDRRKAQRLPIIPTGEYRERAEDWLTDERVTAATLLPETQNRPRMVFPKLHGPITAEETVASWESAADHGLYSWSERMSFLENWTVDQLSGYDPEQQDADRLTIIPTVYDVDREGTVADQMAAKPAELDVTTIFEGSLLARRYKGQPRIWKDSYVRGIDLEPTKVDVYDCVPYAYVYVDGNADVFASDVQYDNAARLQVR